MMKKRILINASTVKISGGLYIALDLISAFINTPQLNIKIVCPNIKPFLKFSGFAEFSFVPNYFLKYLMRPIMDYIWLPRLIRKYDPYIIISLSNLPAVTQHFQIFFHDNAYMSRENLKGLNLDLRTFTVNSLRQVIFASRLKFINHFIVQTSLEKSKLIKKYPKTPGISVIPPILPSHLTLKTTKFIFEASPNVLKIGCAAMYFAHKNLEILYTAAEIADRRNLPIQFVLTISNKQGRAAKRLVQAINENNFNSHIINVKKIPQSKISSFINSVDALILPSLCESYGLNCLEAWFHEKPYLVSDTDFGHEVCSTAALYFDPLDANSIISLIELLLSSDREINSCIITGKALLRDLSTASEIVIKILSIRLQ